MKCPHCGYQNQEGEMFCSYCSKEISPLQKKAEAKKRYCISCGRPMGFNDYACQHCGHTDAKKIPETPKPRASKVRHCVFCGRSIDWNAQVCTYCGYDYRGTTRSR